MYLRLKWKRARQMPSPSMTSPIVINKMDKIRIAFILRENVSEFLLCQSLKTIWCKLCFRVVAWSKKPPSSSFPKTEKKPTFRKKYNHGIKGGKEENLIALFFFSEFDTLWQRSYFFVKECVCFSEVFGKLIRRRKHITLVWGADSWLWMR